MLNHNYTNIPFTDTAYQLTKRFAFLCHHSRRRFIQKQNFWFAGQCRSNH